MKKEMKCNIVQDLLPNYIEALTSNETNEDLEEHLRTCRACNNIYNQMNEDIGISVNLPKIEFNFFKKIKRTRILAALLSIILSLLLSYLLYSSEYNYKQDKVDLSRAVSDFFTPFDSAIEPYVLETKTIGKTMIASFKDQADPSSYGVATFVKGINQRYRIIRGQRGSSDYSAVALVFPMEIKKEHYYAISGYNLSDDIEFYSIDYNAYKSPGQLSKDRVKKSLQFQVENPQFLELYLVDELNERLVEEADERMHDYWQHGTSLYDREGNEITENFRVRDNNSNKRAGGGKAELFLIYVFIGIVIGLGIIMTRYFLIE